MRTRTTIEPITIPAIAPGERWCGLDEEVEEDPGLEEVGKLEGIATILGEVLAENTHSETLKVREL